MKIVLEHVSSDYGVDFVNSNSNIAGTITPHHMLLTKDDVFKNKEINPHHYCMPVVKNEKDLIALRKAACFDNNKFFLGTDSAPHHTNDKVQHQSLKPGIFSSPCTSQAMPQIAFKQYNTATIQTDAIFDNFFESFSELIELFRITAAATTGPAKQPLPTSSTPAIIIF